MKIPGVYQRLSRMQSANQLVIATPRRADGVSLPRPQATEDDVRRIAARFEAGQPVVLQGRAINIADLNYQRGRCEPNVYYTVFSNDDVEELSL
jgi:hypothetical protein